MFMLFCCSEHLESHVNLNFLVWQSHANVACKGHNITIDYLLKSTCTNRNLNYKNRTNVYFKTVNFLESTIII